MILDANGHIERLPPYVRLDLRVAKTWSFDRFRVEAYLDVFNVTASEEVLAYESSTPIGVRLVLPILGVKGTY